MFAFLFQQAIDTGILGWSLANICSLFKKKVDRSRVYNYCSVFLTCVLCKILAHKMCSNILAYLDEHKLLSHRQNVSAKVIEVFLDNKVQGIHSY